MAEFNNDPSHYINERYREQNEKRNAFATLVREKLEDILKEHDYKLIHDNKDEDQKNSHNWVFKLIFSGKKVIEVSNDDYRDYTEYFYVYVDGVETFVIKTDDYHNGEEAFADFKERILKLVNVL